MVHPQDGLVGIGHDHAVLRLEGDGRNLQVQLGALALRNVPCHAQKIDELACLVVHAGEPHLGPDRTAVFARLLQLCTEVRGLLVGLDRFQGPRHSCLCDFGAGGRERLVNRLLHGFGHGVASQPFHGRAHVGVAPVEVHGPDHVGRVVGQKAVPLFRKPRVSWLAVRAAWSLRLFR